MTHPRNAGGSDLRCPFGCREVHRKQRSTERSVAYYATAEGKMKKKTQNGKRAQGGVRRDAHPPVPEALDFPAGTLGCVAMVANLIEGRPVSEAEILQMLVRAMRPHRMARRRRMDYVVAQLQKNGP